MQNSLLVSKSLKQKIIHFIIVFFVLSLAIALHYFVG